MRTGYSNGPWTVLMHLMALIWLFIIEGVGVVCGVGRVVAG